MKVLTWNVRRAIKEREDVWGYFLELDPDIALLQEVGSVPDYIASNYSVLLGKAYAGNGQFQKFHTSVIVKGSITKQLNFSSQWDWVNEELQTFKGNIIPTEISLASGERFRVVSAYCPAWPIFKRERHKEIDVSVVKLKKIERYGLLRSYGPVFWVRI
jgi:exonuclease III